VAPILPSLRRLAAPLIRDAPPYLKYRRTSPSGEQ
jgi:hypothetical protein